MTPIATPLPLLPPANWWNVDISASPVDPNSANFINFIGASTGLHPDFGGDVDPEDPSNPKTYDFPYASVSATQPLVPLEVPIESVRNLGPERQGSLPVFTS